MPKLFLQDLWQEKQSDSEGNRIAIERFPYVIGRHPDCDHQLSHGMISRRHCALVARGNHVWVEDLDSRNGTFINGERVQQPQPIRDGDVLSVAHVAFKVSVPTLAEASDRVSASGSRAGGPHHVLVVEDNADAAEMLALLLKGWGHEVQVAHNGPQAIQAAMDHQPDTVLLDIRLPGMDGYQVAQRLRQQAGMENTRMVGITGYDQERYRNRSREVGLERLLTKPVDPNTLHQLLEQPG